MVCTCALQRIFDHTLGTIELTKIHQNNVFSSNAEQVHFTCEIASSTVALEMEFFKEEIFVISLI